MPEFTGTLILPFNSVSGRWESGYEPLPTGIAHGNLFSIQAPGSGTKTDYNTGNYTFAGHRHMHHRFTDFENALTTTPAVNTEAAWREHLQGIYPIVTSEDFNPESVESGATLELTGGPTVSGRRLRRQTSDAIAAAYPANHRLRNWNLFSNNGYKGKGYLSCFVKTFVDDNTGKYFRIYWDSNPEIVPETLNFYAAKSPGGNQFTWRIESSSEVPGGYADQFYDLNDRWLRHELFFDNDADSYSFWVDGLVQTDVSRGYEGVVDGLLGPNRVFNYGLLGNTVDPRLEDGHTLEYAMPMWDFDSKRIEIADSPVWETKTRAIPCPAVSWVNDNVTFVINQGDFADLENKHIYYLNGMTATYIGELTNGNV